MDFFFQLPTYYLFVIIFCLILLSNWGGYAYRKNQLKRFPDRKDESIGSIQGSLLGVMSLLLGFTFSVAVSKFESRRIVIVQEANHIGTAILRCDLYPDSVRAPLLADFKLYLESRIAYYHAGNDEDLSSTELAKAAAISKRIWNIVAFYSQNPNYVLRSQQMVPAVNDLIDIVATRDASRISKVPHLVLYTLLTLVVVASFLLGADYKGHKRNLMLLFGYAFVMTLTLNLISELNHPREGMINLDEVETKMEDLRKLFVERKS